MPRRYLNGSLLRLGRGAKAKRASLGRQVFERILPSRDSLLETGTCTRPRAKGAIPPPRRLFPQPPRFARWPASLSGLLWECGPTDRPAASDRRAMRRFCLFVGSPHRPAARAFRWHLQMYSCYSGLNQWRYSGVNHPRKGLFLCRQTVRLVFFLARCQKTTKARLPYKNRAFAGLQSGFCHNGVNRVMAGRKGRSSNLVLIRAGAAAYLRRLRTARKTA